MAIYQVVGIIIAAAANLVAIGATVHAYTDKLRVQSLDTATAFADRLSKYGNPTSRQMLLERMTAVTLLRGARTKNALKGGWQNHALAAVTVGLLVTVVVLNLTLFASAFPDATPKPVGAAASVLIGTPAPAGATLTLRQQLVLNVLIVVMFAMFIIGQRLTAWKAYVIGYSKLSGTQKIPSVNAICHWGYTAHPELLADRARIATGQALHRLAMSIPVIDDTESSIRFELEYTHLITTLEERYAALSFKQKLAGITVMPYIRLKYGHTGDRRRKRLANSMLRRADRRHKPMWTGTEVELRMLNRKSAGWRPSAQPR
ncbi:hypothetical protein [Mycolicibacterium fortuitum]|uniref:hypothetical protein n=1 Tax=Mycolicibacterium fortuitum TaxID=1766 RepID=UPI001041EA1C|nr:hypothetical protein [Mycolicibacterium fortuitum]